MVLAEADRVRNLVGKFVNANLDAKCQQRAHDVGIEVGNGSREEPDLLFWPSLVETRSTWSMKSKSS